MPLKTNVGVSRKVADNNYGSRGASVNLEVELDSTLIQEPELLQQRIRQVFRLAQQAIDEELTRQQDSSTGSQATKGVIGGVTRINELLALVKEIGGLKKFKDLLEAMSVPVTDAIPF